MATTLDLMEYASDALAQAAYVTSATPQQIDHATGTSFGDLTGNGGLAAIFDDNTNQAWAACGIDPYTKSAGYAGKDWGAGVTNIISKYIIYGGNDAGYDNADISEGNTITIKLYGSNSSPANGTDGALLHTDTFINDAYETDPHTYTTGITQTPYRYHWVYITTSHASRRVGFSEIQFFSSSLQSYSEATIKSQGSYSLKGVASTGAINKTLTRTIGSPIDLTGATALLFDIYSSRTGSNITMGIHDSGGTTTEITPSVASANTWQTVVWDISGVSNANKDAINSIIITIANADSANTFYIDNFLTADNVSITAEPFIITTSLSASEVEILAGYGYAYEEDATGTEINLSVRTGDKVGQNILQRKCLKYIYYRINTHGKDVTMTIYADGVAQTPTFTINTTSREMQRLEDVPAIEGYRFDIGLTCADVTDDDLEIYSPLALQLVPVGV